MASTARLTAIKEGALAIDAARATRACSDV